MSNKIYDIIPPGEQENFAAEEEKKSPKRFFLNSRILIILLFSVLIAGAFYFLVGERAEIDIWPKTKNLTFETHITVDTNSEEIDFSKHIIPGEIIEAEKTVSETFPSSGDAFKRAEGTIRLYNRFANWPEVWAEGTRFISSNGKLFKSKSKISVPAAKKEGGKVVASYVDVLVIAAEPGEEYNIGPSNFSIYVYRGTERYAYYWGESSESMSGGGESVKVTEKDLETAEEILSERALLESKDLLKKKVPEGWLLVDSLIESEITEFSPLAKDGQGVDSFMAQIKAKARAIIFKEESLERFAEEYISSDIESGEILCPGGLKTEHYPSLSGNGNKGNTEMVLNVDFSVKVYTKIEEEFLKRQVLGKTASESEQKILQFFPEIERVEIRLWPFWVKKAPIEKRFIKLNFKFE